MTEETKDTPERPRRRFEIDIHVDGDQWDDIMRELQRLVIHVEDHGAQCRSVGGGYTTGHIVSVRYDPEMTCHRYHEKLDEYLEAIEGKAS